MTEIANCYWKQINLKSLVYIYIRKLGHRPWSMFSMAVGTIWEWLKLVSCFVKGRTVDSEEGDGSF